MPPGETPAKRRDPFGMSRKEKYALVLLEHADCPGVLTSSATARIDGQPWIHWRTARSLQSRGFVRIVWDDDDAEVVMA